ncbi:hypothetical protein BJ741DRAFT_332373 [Chytriomyces cf. hyalinus JEL632]|nr:hypothetical protein BJ741DRAFT_332373 [Chytriomyces cf. hyalinus JEL632]
MSSVCARGVDEELVMAGCCWWSWSIWDWIEAIRSAASAFVFACRMRCTSCPDACMTPFSMVKLSLSSAVLLGHFETVAFSLQGTLLLQEGHTLVLHGQLLLGNAGVFNVAHLVLATQSVLLDTQVLFHGLFLQTQSLALLLHACILRLFTEPVHFVFWLLGCGVCFWVNFYGNCDWISSLQERVHLHDHTDIFTRVVVSSKQRHALFGHTHLRGSVEGLLETMSQKSLRAALLRMARSWGTRELKCQL